MGESLPPKGKSAEEMAERNQRDANQALAGYSQSRPQVQGVRYTHDAMIDLLITEPGISQNRIASYFGYSAPWVSTIMASDAFQVRLAQRRGELIDPTIAASIEERFKALTVASVEKLMRMIGQPEIAVDPEILLKAAALGAKSLGIGGHAPTQTLNLISPETRLKALAGRLTGLLATAKTNEGVVDVQANEIVEQPRG